MRKNAVYAGIGRIEMTIQELFIINLKDYRKARRLSQMQLAEKCDSAQAYIAEIEVGKKFPSPAMIERIASALDIESYFLFQNEPVLLDGKERRLTPVQRQEITDQIYSAAEKIISRY
jgi:transcriptional regulator with XRE-family HTH domain